MILKCDFLRINFNSKHDYIKTYTYISGILSEQALLSARRLYYYLFTDKILDGKYITKPKGNCPPKGTGSEWRIIENRKQQGYRRSCPERTKTVKNSALYKELSTYQEAGVQLWLNGKRSNSYRIADCVCEKTDYMRDYYVDMENHVCGIGFDKIRKDKQEKAEFPYAKA